MPLTCDDCGKVSQYLLNCYCRSMVCRECRFVLHLAHHGPAEPDRCVICRMTTSEGHMTCSPEHHEAFLMLLEREFGTHKKITRMTTGETFLVPVRDIVEKGVKEHDLDQYPKEVASQPPSAKAGSPSPHQ